MGIKLKFLLFTKKITKSLREPRKLNIVPDNLTKGLVGRSNDVKMIHDILFKAKKNVVITGEEGIGKTTAAQEYIRKYRFEYEHIVYISMTKPAQSVEITRLEDGYYTNRSFAFDALLYTNLGVETPAAHLHKTYFEDILKKLSELTGVHNLMVIDDAGIALSRRLDFFPSQPQWHILATSPNAIEKFETYPLSILPQNEVEILFKKHYTLPIDSYSDLDKIFKTLNYHTLSIELLGKTAQCSKIAVSDLWKMIDFNNQYFLTVVEKHLQPNDKIKNAHDFILARLMKKVLSSPEKSYLQALSIMPSQPFTARFLGQILNIYDKDFKTFTHNLEGLSAKGFLTKEAHFSYNEGFLSEPNKDTTYQCHPFLQGILRAVYVPNVDKNTVLIGSLSRLLKRKTEKFEFNHEIKRAFIIAESVFKVLQKNDKEWGEKDRYFANLAEQLGYIYRQIDHFSRSTECRLLCLEIAEKTLHNKHPLLGRLYSNIAFNFNFKGHYTTSLVYSQKALPIWEAFYEDYHPQLALIYFNIAKAYLHVCDYKTALIYNQKGLAIQEMAFDKWSTALARSYYNIALNYSLLGQTELALKYQLKNLNIIEALLEYDDPDLAMTYNNIGVSYSVLDDYDNAVKYHLKALSIREYVLDNQHHNLALSYHNLAACYYFSKDFDNAKIYMDRAIAIRKAIFKDTHPALLDSLDWQAEINEVLSARIDLTELYELSA